MLDVEWGLLDCLCYPTSFPLTFAARIRHELVLRPLQSRCETESPFLLGLIIVTFVFIVSYLMIRYSNPCISFVDYDEFGREEFSFGNRAVPNGVDRDGPVLSKLGSSSTAELHPKAGAQGESKPVSMPPTSVMTRLILIMVWRKLIRNPNTYSSLIGLTWSLVSFRYAMLNDSSH